MHKIYVENIALNGQSIICVFEDFTWRGQN